MENNVAKEKKNEKSVMCVTLDKDNEKVEKRVKLTIVSDRVAVRHFKTARESELYYKAGGRWWLLFRHLATTVDYQAAKAAKEPGYVPRLLSMWNFENKSNYNDIYRGCLAACVEEGLVEPKTKDK